jgi:FAD/FMN-containing dehydrogenase
MTDLMEKTFDWLDRRLPGQVSRPGDGHYAAATAIWAKPVGRTPRAVVHCRNADDVRSAVRAARDCDLPLSVRGGGHDWAGRALCDGIVLDLRAMRDVRVSSDRRSAWIGGGVRAADVLAVTDPLGVAAVAGSVGSVGMAGFTLGGGYGALIGRFGLALDNLIAAEVVLADGRIVVAAHDQEEELLWALRGGGGNFGVVTAMHHRLHALTGVRTGVLVYPFREAGAVLRRSVDVAASTPAELTVQLAVVAAPDGAPVLLIVPTWCGPAGESEAQLAPFLRLGTLLAGAVDAVSYGVSLTAFDPYIVAGQRILMETCWLPALDGRGIDACIGAMEIAVSAGCAIITHEFKGAAARVPVEATAFGLRQDHVLVEILAAFDAAADALEEERHRRWTRSALQAFDAIALPGGYPNLLVCGDAERVTKSYGPNANRLISAKQRYDPAGVFSSAIPLPAGCPQRPSGLRNIP